MVNSSLQRIHGGGILRGFYNLMRIELKKWWGAMRWWINLIVWVCFVNGCLQINLSVQSNTVENILLVFFSYLGLTAIGIIIVTHGAVIGDKTTGTAVWILSKPASRMGYIMSKIIGNMIGSLITMVIIPGIIGYFQISLAFGNFLSFPNFMTGLNMSVLFDLQFLMLTIMLGIMCKRRGPVLGVAIGFLVFQNLIGRVEKITFGKFLPWALVFPNNGNKPSIASLLVQGQEPSSVIPIYVTIFLILVFLIFALWAFYCEEL